MEYNSIELNKTEGHAWIGRKRQSTKSIESSDRASPKPPFGFRCLLRNPFCHFHFFVSLPLLETGKCGLKKKKIKTASFKIHRTKEIYNKFKWMSKWCCSKLVAFILLKLLQLKNCARTFRTPCVALWTCVCVVCVLVKTRLEATVLTYWGFLFISSTWIQSDLSNVLFSSSLSIVIN